ncbi:hypothetical protein ABH926_006972 [Catenulispora sp. GP43]
MLCAGFHSVRWGVPSERDRESAIRDAGRPSGEPARGGPDQPIRASTSHSTTAPSQWYMTTIS